MKIVCTNCSHDIENENINAEKDFFYCVNCQNAYKISDLLNEHNENDTIPYKEIINNPPKGTWKLEDPEKIVIGSTTRSPIAFFLVPFMIIWSGGSIGGIYVTQIISRKFDLFSSLFGIPFLIGSIIFWSVTLMAIVGKVEVTIGKDSFVFTGVWKIGIKRKFDWNSIIHIYEDRNYRSGFFQNNRYSSSIIMEGKTRIKFGIGLKEDRKFYLLNALKYFHSRKKNYRY